MAVLFLGAVHVPDLEQLLAVVHQVVHGVLRVRPAEEFRSFLLHFELQKSHDVVFRHANKICTRETTRRQEATAIHRCAGVSTVCKVAVGGTQHTASEQASSELEHVCRNHQPASGLLTMAIAVNDEVIDGKTTPLIRLHNGNRGA